jgi:hypothetical protein
MLIKKWKPYTKPASRKGNIISNSVPRPKGDYGIRSGQSESLSHRQGLSIKNPPVPFWPTSDRQRGKANEVKKMGWFNGKI